MSQYNHQNRHNKRKNNAKCNQQYCNKYDQYIEKELTGRQFNKIYHDKFLVKLTNMEETHNGFKFDDGLNADTISFNTNITCSSGGMYFIEECNMHKWIFYNSVVGFMYYVRKVTIPDDARVYVEIDKFKADKIMLGPRERIDKNTYIKAIKHDNIIFKNMPDDLKDRDICMEAIRNDEYNHDALCYVSLEIKDKDMCAESVKLCGKTLQYVPHHLQDRDMCEDAIKYNGIMLEFVEDSLKDEELCMISVKCYGHMLKYVPDSIKNREICMEAIKQNNHAFRYVPRGLIDKDMCMEVVGRCGIALPLVPIELRDMDVCKAAVEQCDFAIYYVPSKLRKVIHQRN